MGQRLRKEYMGDGVYVAFDGYALVLTTEDGVSVTNTIVIEPEVWTALGLRRASEGGQVMGYLNAVGMAGSLPLRLALSWHLQSNHYQPVPAAMVPLAERAVRAARRGQFTLNLKLPAGVRYRGKTTVTVSAAVESLHLDAFLDVDAFETSGPSPQGGS